MTEDPMTKLKKYRMLTVIFQGFFCSLKVMRGDNHAIILYQLKQLSNIVSIPKNYVRSNIQMC